MANTSHGSHVMSHGQVGSQLGFQSLSSLTSKNISFAQGGGMSQRKSTGNSRERKRRTTGPQGPQGPHVLGDESANAPSASSATGRHVPLFAVHKTEVTKAAGVPVPLCNMIRSHQGSNDPAFKPIEGPLLQESPLGLTLKKTPSLLDLISNALGSRSFEGWGLHGDVSQSVASPQSRPFRQFGTAPGMLAPFIDQGPADKLKASNFAALSAKIGTWERHSRYEGDLVAKCYFAKKKLVWEVLDKGLKSKIEVQWGDIRRIKAVCSDTEPGVLEIEITKAPMFFHELNPQPRKHTIWSSASDFTGGQATLARKHVLTFPPGILEPHYKKLLMCDSRLRAMAAGLPEPLAMRPPPNQKTHLQVPGLPGSVPFAAAPRPSSHGLPIPSAAPAWSGLVDTMERVLLQEQPGSPSSVIARGDRPFGEESGSSEEASHLLPPPAIAFVDANYARESAAVDQDEIMLDSPFPPAGDSAFDFPRSPPAGLFPDMPYDMPGGSLLMSSDMEGVVAPLESCQVEGSSERAREAADRFSSSQGFSLLTEHRMAAHVPSFGSEMSAFHAVKASPRLPYRPPPDIPPLEPLDSGMGDLDTPPGFSEPSESSQGAALASVWRENQDAMVEF